MTEPMTLLPEQARLMSVTYSPTRILDGIKSLSYAANMLATRLAQEQGFDEALLVTPHGRVLEAPTSTIFWVKDGELLTPPLDEHILASITRPLIIDVAGARDQACTLEELYDADEVFLASTVREVEPVAAVDDRSFTAPGPVSERTREARRRADPGAAARLSGRCRSRPRRRGVEGPHGHRQPPAVHQGGGGLTPPAGRPRGDPRPHRPAFRRPPVGRVLRRARTARSGSPAGDRARLGQLADLADARGARAGAPGALAPHAVLVYGDTNSTLAGALAGAQAGIPVAHVEAGMRSFDRTMPEELNRVLVDHASALLLCSTEVAMANLRQEAVAGRAELVGDVMVDVAMAIQPRARERRDLVQARGLAPGEYVLATAHRAGNVDDPARLERLVDLLAGVPADGGPAAAPAHRRAAARRAACWRGSRTRRGSALTEPLGYFELTALLCNARAVLTDSGGLQKEAYLARVPCITLRANTEWTETVELGWNVLVDLDLEAASPRWTVRRRLTARRSTAMATPASASSTRLHCLANERAAPMSEQTSVRRRRRARLLGAEPGPQLRGHPRLRARLPVRRRRRPPGSACCAMFPGAAPAADLDELLDDPALDAVVLATPVPTHAELAVRVLEAGKHCFVEKPLALSVADAERAVAAAEAAGRVLMVGHLLEYHPGVRKLKELTDAGELGEEIYYIYGNRLNLGKLRADENALWSLGAHDVSVLLYLAGEEPYEVVAHGESYVRARVEDVVFCFLRFPSGLTAHLHLSWLDPHKERRFTVVGSRRMATFDDMALEGKLTVYDKGFDEDARGYGEYITRSGGIFSPRIPNIEPLRAECEHFVECIRTGRHARARTGPAGCASSGCSSSCSTSLDAGLEPVVGHRR